MAHKIDGTKVTLDLTELLNVAAIAIRNSKSQVDKYQAMVDNRDSSTHTRQFYCNELARAAREYADAWHTYHILEEAKIRERIEVVTW